MTDPILLLLLIVIAANALVIGVGVVRAIRRGDFR